MFVVITVAPAFLSFCRAFSTNIPWTAKQVTFFAPSFFIAAIALNKVFPVDQTLSQIVRAEFSKQIHGKSPKTIRNYWQQQIFSGRGIPPPEKSSDMAVILYVQKHPGAIGYVSNKVPLRGVKVV